MSLNIKLFYLEGKYDEVFNFLILFLKVGKNYNGLY